MTAEERAAQIVAGVGQDAHHRRSELETKPNARRSVESGTNFPTTNQPTTTMTQEEIIQKQADRLPQGYSLFCWVYNARPSDLGWGVKDLTTGQRIVKSQNTAKQAVDRALPIITNNHNNN